MFSVKVFLIFCLQILFYGKVFGKSSFDISNYRLPNNTKPFDYEIDITTRIDRDDFKFSGISAIKFLVLEDTSEIVIHSKLANRKKLAFELKNIQTNRPFLVLNFMKNYTTDMLKLQLLESLEKGKTYELRVSYESTLREDNLGFYRSFYVNEKDKKIWIATTQFAPTEARHAFPCYDEPRFKATFTLKITYPNDRESISNTDVEQTWKNPDGTKTTLFKKTPIMSTYIFGFVVSDFANRTATSQTLTHQVFVRRNALQHTHFATSYGFEVYETLLNYFGYNTQPLTTMKGVGIPDFYFSAMENWGMINYKESRILFDKSIHGAREILNIVLLLSHEMSHQWFGNLATMEWWTYVWLSEGFATLFEFYAADLVFPHWNLMERYQILVFQSMLTEDASARPMNKYVEQQSHIMAGYDKIAYDKASCVLRMFDHALGRSVFKRGLDLYLSNRKFNSSTEDDLFSALNTSLAEANNTQLNIYEAMGSWTSQTGFPYVSVTIKNETVKIKQYGFLSGPVEKYPIWHIPINFATPNGSFNDTTPKYWMTTETMEINIDNANYNSTNDWMIFNIQQTSFYRVNYNRHNWDLIVQALNKNHSSIHVANRAQILDDVFVITKSNQINYEVLMNLLEYLVNERDYAPWGAFDTGIEYLKKELSETEWYPNFVRLMQKIISPAFKDFGLIKIENETPLVSRTREIIARRACEFNVTDCVQSKMNFNVSDMRSIFYCNRMTRDENSTFFELKHQLVLTEDFSVRLDLLTALGCASNETILRVLLLRIVQSKDDFLMNPGEKLLLFKNIYRNSQKGLEMSLNFTFSNWKDLNRTLGENNFIELLLDITTFVKIRKWSDLVENFLLNLDIKTEIKDKALMNMWMNFEWDLMQRPTITDWLTENYPNNSATLTKSAMIFVSLILLIEQLLVL